MTRENFYEDDYWNELIKVICSVRDEIDEKYNYEIVEITRKQWKDYEDTEKRNFFENYLKKTIYVYELMDKDDYPH